MAAFFLLFRLSLPALPACADGECPLIAAQGAAFWIVPAPLPAVPTSLCTNSVHRSLKPPRLLLAIPDCDGTYLECYPRRRPVYCHCCAGLRLVRAPAQLPWRVNMESALLLMSLLGAGAIAGLSAGLFGVGGGFVVVPALLLVIGAFGQSSAQDVHLAIGTSLATIVVTSLRALHAHSHRGAVDFKVLRDWAPWLVVGALGGVALAAAAGAKTLLLVFALGVLCYAIYFLRPDFMLRRERHYSFPQGAGRAALASGLAGFSALLGIGGGTPFVVTMVVCGRSVHQAVATAAGVGCLIALPGALGFLVLGWAQPGLPPGSVGYINVPAFAAIAAMSVITAPVGARWAHSLSEVHLRRAFGAYLLLVAFSMFSKFLAAQG